MLSLTVTVIVRYIRIGDAVCLCSPTVLCIVLLMSQTILFLSISQVNQIRRIIKTIKTSSILYLSPTHLACSRHLARRATNAHETHKHQAHLVSVFETTTHDCGWRINSMRPLPINIWWLLSDMQQNDIERMYRCLDCERVKPSTCACKPRNLKTI